MKRLVAVGIGVSALAALGLAVFAGAGCAAMSCCSAGGSSGQPHGDVAMMAAGQPAQRRWFANTKCPIMGRPIDPAKVTESLTRDYKGQKVAFCCPCARLSGTN